MDRLTIFFLVLCLGSLIFGFCLNATRIIELEKRVEMLEARDGE